jgi:CheY-like chemotaxis protein
MATIMVVDDDEDGRETLAQILQDAGHKVILANSGSEALDVLDKGEPLDLLLIEVIMPGLNGFNLARMARYRRPSIRILYLTGFYRQAETLRDEGTKYGKLLIKPILPADLINEVTAALMT